MTEKWPGVSIGVAAAIVIVTSLATSADLQPAVVTNPAGTLRVQQRAPCDNNIDRTTAVTRGRLEFLPADGLPAAGGGRFFTLTRATLTFAPFSVSGSCLGFSQTRNYSEVNVNVVRSVSFTATPTPTPNVYGILIPRGAVEVYYATTVNGARDIGYKQPKQDVTGTIDLAAGTVQLRLVFGTRVTFKEGCSFLGCIIDETHDGTLTANINGPLVFPDSDGDGVADRLDNCRFGWNPAQTAVPTPQITAPPNVTLASCLSRAFGPAAALDVCDRGPVTVTSDAPSQFTVGPTLVTWRAVDAFNREATATQTVTVVDTTPPTFTSVPPDVFLNDCGPANLGLPVATDDCAGTPTLGNNAPAKFFVGVTPVIWTATDASGNQRTTQQNVTVVDTVPPQVYCVPTTPTGTSFRVSAIDSCTASPPILLGDYALQQGEIIMINETGQSGVRLHNDIAGGIRQFHVGRGEAVLRSVDESGNVGTVTCVVPR